MTVTVAIPTFRRPHLLARAVASVASQSLDRPFELLVVDSAAEGLDARDLPSANLGGTARVVQARRPGTAHARNLALHEARGEIVAFLDDDAEAAPGWLHALSREYADRECAAAGGPILPDFQTSPPAWLRVAYDVIANEFSALDHGAETRILEYPKTLYGPNLSVRRGIAVACGGFREDLGPRGRRWRPGEEVELIHRLQGLGHRIHWVPAAVVRHSVPRHKMSRGFFRRRAYARGLSAALGELSGPEASLPGDLRVRHAVGAAAYHVILSQLLWLARRPRAAIVHDRVGARWAGIVEGTLRRTLHTLRAGTSP